MKTFFLLSLLSSLTLLVSCGSQKSTAKLEVTNSALSVSNNSFAGGIVIMGKSSEGSFTIPVSFNGSNSSTSITVELKKTEWTFTAVAWAGSGTAPKEFQGNTICAARTVNLQNDKEVVNLSLLATTCSTRPDLFGPAAYFSGTQYRSLRVATCGWLYEDNAVTPVSSTTPLNFCRPAATFEDIYKRYSKTIKLEIPQRINGVQTTGLSICLSSTPDGLLNSRNLSLPALGVPVKISLYDSLSCLEGGYITSFNFENGLGGPVTGQDSVFVTDGITMNLFLPANETRRGYTSFYNSLPRITCGGSDCMNVPATSPSNRIVKPNHEFLIAGAGTNLKCSDILGMTPTSAASFGGTAPTLVMVQTNCRALDNGALVTSINYPGPLSSAVMTILFSGAITVTLSLSEQATFDAFATGWDLFGHPGKSVAEEIFGSFRAFYENKGNEKSRGVLSKITNMFDPDGPAGVLGQLTCATATADKMISFIEDGFSKTYRIKLESNPGTTVPASIADATYLAGSPFTKRIYVQRLVSETPILFDTQITIDFICNQKIGRIENVESRDNEEEKTVLEWNTRTSGSQKALLKELSIESDGSGVVRYDSSETKVMQMDPVSAKAVSFSLRVEKVSGGNYEYKPRKVVMVSNSSDDRVYYKEKGNSYTLSGYNSAVLNSTIGSDLNTPSNNICLGLSSTTFAIASGSGCVSTGGVAGTEYTNEIVDFNDLLESAASTELPVALPVIPLPI